MKRVILAGTLVLIIIASLLSGTLAIYSKTIDLGSGSIIASSASSFVFLVEGKQNFQSTLKIAPTETVAFIFDVCNFDGAIVSETAMHYDLTIDVSAALGKTAIGPLTVNVKNEENEILDTLTGTGTFQFSNDFLISAVGQSDTYIVECYWPNTDSDIDFEGDDYSTQIGISATATQLLGPQLPSSFTAGISGSLIDKDEFLTKSRYWTYGTSGRYDLASWSGYLEKMLEKGSGNNARKSQDTGKNKIHYSNPVSGKTAVFNWNNWNGVKNSYPSYVPPAILITNDYNLAPGSSYIANNVNSLKGSVIIYKANYNPVSETVVYFVDEDGSASEPQLLIDCLS